MSDTTTPIKNAWQREADLRMQLHALGFRLNRDPVQRQSQEHQGKYQIADENGRIVLGRRFEASLDEVENYLRRTKRIAAITRAPIRAAKPEASEIAREVQLRRLAIAKGWFLRKDNARLLDFEHQGGYQIIDRNGQIKWGPRFELTLGDVEDFLNRLD